MRTSKISRDASRVLEALNPPVVGPGRATRSTSGILQKFAYTENSSSMNNETANVAFKNSTATFATSVSRKRKREVPENPAVSTTATIVPRIKSPPSSPVVAPKPKKLARKRQDTVTSAKEPKNWRIIYNTLRSFRSTFTAPVDTMGCERLGDPNASPRHQRFHVLVGLLLSSQTKDAVTSTAVRNLQSTLPGGLSPESVDQPSITVAQLDACINKVGFHNTKAKNLKTIAGLLQEQHNGDVPKTPEELMALPGIGPKMAYLCLSAAWDIDLGIGVDTHVHRITNLWGWHKTKTPEETRIKLETWLPKENWHEINTLVVGLGQTVCAPGEGRNRRRCGECGLGAICPASSVKRSLTAKAKIEEVTVMDEVKAEVVDIEDMGDILR